MWTRGVVRNVRYLVDVHHDTITGNSDKFQENLTALAKWQALQTDKGNNPTVFGSALELPNYHRVIIA
jgi:hypothetical protein